MNAAPLDAQITFLYTRDLSRSARFYEHVLGLELAVDQGSCRIYRIKESSAFLGICQRDDAPENTSSLIFTLVTSDVDLWHDRIVARGWGLRASATPQRDLPESTIFSCATRRVISSRFNDLTARTGTVRERRLARCLHSSGDAIDGRQRGIQDWPPVGIVFVQLSQLAQ